MPSTRFPDEVAEVLRAAGWFEGRDTGDQVQEWVSRVVAKGIEEERPYQVSPPAFDILREFGGLRFTPETVAGYKGYPFVMNPTNVAWAVDGYAELEEEIGKKVFPVGATLGDSLFRCVDEDGRIFGIHTTGEYFCGETIEAALSNLILGKRPKEVHFDGTWDE